MEIVDSLLNSEKSELQRNLSELQNLDNYDLVDGIKKGELFNCRFCRKNSKYSTTDPGKMIKHTMKCHGGEFQRCNKCKPNFTCFHRKDFIQHHFRCHMCST